MVWLKMPTHSRSQRSAEGNRMGKGTASAVSMYNHCAIRRRFHRVKTNFDFFIFLQLTSNQFTIETRRKSWNKNALLLKKTLKKLFFFYRRFLIAVFFGGEQFSPTSEAYYYRPIHTSTIPCCQKSGGGL